MYRAWPRARDSAAGAQHSRSEALEHRLDITDATSRPAAPAPELTVGARRAGAPSSKPAKVNAFTRGDGGHVGARGASLASALDNTNGAAGDFLRWRPNNSDGIERRRGAFLLATAGGATSSTPRGAAVSATVPPSAPVTSCCRLPALEGSPPFVAAPPPAAVAWGCCSRAVC